MANSLQGKDCRNCVRMFIEAGKRGDMAAVNKYLLPGRYVKVSETNDSFSYSKALVGTAVFGGVGAVAGINGKKTVTYRCNKCGHEIIQKE